MSSDWVVESGLGIRRSDIGGFDAAHANVSTGTHEYVWIPHAAAGMEGSVVVEQE